MVLARFRLVKKVNSFGNFVEEDIRLAPQARYTLENARLAISRIIRWYRLIHGGSIMRLLVAVLVVFLSQFLSGTSEFACADEPAEFESGSLKRIWESVRHGNSSAAVTELRTLPSQQRLEWLSQVHQHRGDQKPNGGGSIADYTELIGLIENVIDAEWAVNGGTSSMVPYRQGVRIDPQGLIERFDPSVSSLTSLKFPRNQEKTENQTSISLTELGEWQQASSLRWISLHQLDKQISERIRDPKGLRANISMELLGGLYRIDYVAFDKDSQEWFLGGPAGNLGTNASRELLNSESGLPPVLLEDLLGIAPHVLRNNGEFGCSIDPDPRRLTEAYEMARSTSAMRLMQRQPERWAEQWRQKLGRQHAKVIGLKQDSPTGYALLIADAHMKRLGLGLEACPTQMKSYWQEKDALESINHSTDAGLVRWWFSLTDHKIPMDPDRKIYHLASSNVQVLSEAQMMNLMGDRVAASSPDLAADNFAKKFTRNFDRLQRDYPVYGRLRHIFDLAIALEIVRHEIKNGNGKPFLSIDNPDVQPRLSVPPRELDSVAATHRTPSGAMSVMISGGVAIHTSRLSRRFVVDKSQTNKVAIESSNDVSKLANTELSESSKLKSEAERTLILKRDIPFWK